MLVLILHLIYWPILKKYIDGPAVFRYMLLYPGVKAALWDLLLAIIWAINMTLNDELKQPINCMGGA
jgi:hypothetical protein